MSNTVTALLGTAEMSPAVVAPPWHRRPWPALFWYREACWRPRSRVYGHAGRFASGTKEKGETEQCVALFARRWPAAPMTN